MRVSDLAKELNVAAKDLVRDLAALGADVRTTMSVVDESFLPKIKAEYERRAKEPPPPPPPPKKKAPPKEPPPAEKPAPKAEPVPVVPPPPAVEAPAPVPAKPAESPAKVERAAKGERPAKATGAKTGGKTKVVEEPKKEEPPPAPITVVGKAMKAPGPVVVKEFAERLGIKPNALIAELMGINVFASINERIDLNIAKRIAEKHGSTLEHEKKEAGYVQVQRQREAQAIEEDVDREEERVARPPIVTFMGHVDHGKTSLLDRIRKTEVAKGEFGGITQHIGAYTVHIGGRQITFLDTPGHQAFTSMRARGARLTDIAVIIIAADDGVMPQTQEAISHAQAAQVSLMVAINKIDLPGANVDRVKKQLQAMGLSPEDWGGDVICCPVSATTGKGVDHLLEMILLQADMLELRANPRRKARGYIIEAQLEPGMGPTAHVIVTSGTLKVGDAILCGQYWGRVRALVNDHGVKVNTIGPAIPAKCLGLSGVPEAGAEFNVCKNDREARNQAEELATQTRTEQLVTPKRASLDDLYDQLKKMDRLELKVMVKTDTQGSLEAIRHSLGETKSEKVSLSIVYGSTGNITVNDVMLASASDAIILGFQVSKEPGVDEQARREGVEIRLHNIIYDLIDEVRNAMLGLLGPSVHEKVLGHARIQQVFGIGKRGKVAGCVVTDGVIAAKNKVRVIRNKEVLHQGGVASLKHFQDDVSEMKESQECGVRLENYADFVEGDILEFYVTEQIQQTL